jgi:hypothetical protein
MAGFEVQQSSKWRHSEMGNWPQLAEAGLSDSHPQSGHQENSMAAIG